MLSPTTTFDTKRGDLGLVAAAWVDNQQEFLAPMVYPIVEVDLPVDKYTKVKVSSLSKAPNSKRAAGAPFQRDNIEIDQDSYTVDYHGLEAKIPAETVRKYERYIALEQLQTKIKISQMLREMEVALAAHLFNRTTFPIAAATGHDATVPWGTVATSDPALDCNKGIVAVGGQLNDPTGLRAVMSWKAYFNCCRSASLRGSSFAGLRAADTDLSKLLLPLNVLAGMLNVEEVQVGKQNYMSGGTDAAPTLTPVWDPAYCLIYRRANVVKGAGADQIEPGLGFTPVWNKGQGLWEVDSYIEKENNSGIVQVSGNYGFEDCNIEAGYLIGNLA
jgi:hypothetical protein